MHEQARTQELAKLLSEADAAYYDLDDPLMEDSEYDALTEQYRQLTGQKWMRVGQPSELLTRVPHSAPMLSLEKVKSIQELVAWTPASGTFLCTPKIDGLSCAIRYKRGRPYAAISRGDGRVGESVFHSLQPIMGDAFPDEIPYTGELEVRGEIYLIPTDYTKLNELRQEMGQKLFKNPRNAAAGIVRRQKPDHESAHLKFVAYKIVDHRGPHYLSQLEMLQQWGFQVPPSIRGLTGDFGALTPETLHPDHWARSHLPLPYEIDGVVITLDDLTSWRELGETDKYPRFACAYKFESQETVTELLDVIWQVGRSGVVTPVAVFKAVQLCGTTVNRATLHNLKFYLDLGAQIGDKIRVCKSNEVIPRVLGRV